MFRWGSLILRPWRLRGAVRLTSFYLALSIFIIVDLTRTVEMIDGGGGQQVCVESEKVWW